MADLQDLLSSISDEDMAKIKNVAASLMNDSQNTRQEPVQNQQSLGNFDDNAMGKIMSVMGQFNKEDERTRLIQDLKPLLSEERRKKADEAIKFLRLMELLPLLKGMFGQ